MMKEHFAKQRDRLLEASGMEGPTVIGLWGSLVMREGHFSDKKPSHGWGEGIILG